MLATVPVRALIPGSELPTAKDLIGFLRGLWREHAVNFACVDEEGRLGLRGVFLRRICMAVGRRATTCALC